MAAAAVHEQRGAPAAPHLLGERRRSGRGPRAPGRPACRRERDAALDADPRRASPPVSAQPIARFRFWTAWPAAPFTRLSSAEKTTARPGRAGVNRDPAVVGPHHVRQPRWRALDDPHERRAAVEAALERRRQLGRRRRGPHVEGREDAALHRQQVRAEGRARPRGRCARRAPPRSRRRGGACGPARRPRSPRRARRRAGPRAACGRRRSRRSWRPRRCRRARPARSRSSGTQRQQHGGRVAARVGHEPRAAEPLAVDLGQAVGGAAEQLGRRVVLAVPGCGSLRRVGQAQVAGEVDHDGRPDAPRAARRVARGDAVGQRRAGRRRPPARARPRAARCGARAAGREADPRRAGGRHSSRTSSRPV